ncbi:MAG: hypothetical protein IKB89_00225 [Clostridia bacterium]|nr:hypothetical protein [Clostridia bacterium]
MHEMVESFLKQKKSEEAVRKNKHLIDIGLYEKVYSNSTTYSDEFPYPEEDEKGAIINYYKKVAIDITDEEYAEIKKHSFAYSPHKNIIAVALSVIAWVIYIVGFIGGFIIAGDAAAALSYWCGALISGTTFLGFAEIIKLLNDIKNK